MQASIAPPLLFGLATGVAAAVATVASGGGFLLALGAYSMGGASALVVTAVARSAPSRAGAKNAAAREADRCWAESGDMQAAAAASGMVTAGAASRSSSD